MFTRIHRALELQQILKDSVNLAPAEGNVDNTQFLLANLPEECKAQVGIIPEVGHQIPIEAPDQMAHHIIEWMHTTVN